VARFGAPAALAFLLVVELATAPARAAIFDDDEARKRIEALRGRVDQIERSLAQRLDALETKNAGVVDLFKDVEQIKADIAKLRGQYEVLSYELEQVQKRQRALYLDLDSRPNKTPRAFCAPVVVPGEVHLVLTPVGGRDDFDEILDQNVSRILTEIDRLDEIARAFSRYGGAPEERPPAEPTDVAAVIRDVVALETLGDGHVHWESSVEQGLPSALAREDELREVLLNLFENARLAEADTVRAVVRRSVATDGTATITIEVTDDGHGIAVDVLPKIFEPHFSTRTSGSGLGLAISRRMVESWGGEVTIESRLGAGTSVRVTLRAG